MPENLNERRLEIKDINAPESSKGLEGFEVEPTEELKNTVGAIADISQAIRQDKPVKAEAVLAVQKGLDNATVSILGEEFKLGDLSKAKNTSRTLEILREILEGNNKNTSELTFMPLNIAKRVIKNAQAINEPYINLAALETLLPEVAHALAQTGIKLWFMRLHTLPPEVAEQFRGSKCPLSFGTSDENTVMPEETIITLSDTRGGLDLNNVTALSDKAANSLARYEGEWLSIGLEHTSDKVIELLSKYKGELSIGVPDLNENKAKSLGKFQGPKLYLFGITALLPEHAREIANFKGLLSLPNLTELDEDAAEALSHHSGRLILLGVVKISKKVHEILKKHDGPISLAYEGNFSE